MARAFQSVDDYIDSQPEATRTVLDRVRAAIRQAVPEAEEVISYNMPTYKLAGKRFLHFAAWKQHYSLYAATGDVLAAFRDELAPYQVDKGTIRFPFSEPVPATLIARIAKFRAEKIAGRHSASQDESYNRS